MTILSKATESTSPGSKFRRPGKLNVPNTFSQMTKQTNAAAADVAALDGSNGSVEARITHSVVVAGFSRVGNEARIQRQQHRV